MKIGIILDKIWGQIYLLPYIKLTHTRYLNGSYEFTIGWLKWQLSIYI